MAKNYALIPETAMYKNESLKETDMTKNLVNGEFVYRSDVGDESRRRQRWYLLAVGVTGAVLIACLLAATVVREVQVAGLRNELDQLRTELKLLVANFDALNTKFSHEFSDLKTEEDTIYADDDEEKMTVIDPKDPERDRSSYEPLKKLHGLTTMLENDEDLEVDDYTDTDADAESGDWYADYDKREKIGTSNMVKLKPEDFTDAVVSFGEDAQRSSGSGAALIKEIKRMLNENPENPDITIPKLKATTQAPDTHDSRDKRSVFSDVGTSADHIAAPRVIGKTEERGQTKLNSLETSEKRTSPVSRIARNSDYEDGGHKRPFIAAHFHGNTSHLNPEIHEHYKGNGLVRVAHEAPHDVWYPSPWTIASSHPRPTLTRNGHVHVHHTGVYLVYVQIYYLDTHDIISWVLHRTNAEIEGRETLLQCAQSSHSTEPIERPNSCFSAAALFLKSGDRLAVRNTGGDRHSLMQPEKSFIGLFKLADAEDPTLEF